MRAHLAKAFQQEGVTLVVEHVQEVYNPELERNFSHKHSQLLGLRNECQIVTRFHGTSFEAAKSIAREGFRLPSADSDGDFVGIGMRTFYTAEQQDATAEFKGAPLMFGQAIYVSTDLEKATRFAEGVVVVCRCALGKEKVSRQADHTYTYRKLHEQGYDSVRALPNSQEEGGCHLEEHALYDKSQVLPTHVVRFRLVKSGGTDLVGQQIASDALVRADDYSVTTLLEMFKKQTHVDASLDDGQIRACRILADLGRDDQYKTVSKILSDPRIVKHLEVCAVSTNEALAFEALRAWWNLSFNNSDVQVIALASLGVFHLTKLLSCPNACLRWRAVGLIWNLTQHSESCRQGFVSAGAVEKLGACVVQALEAVFSSSSPQWGPLQLLLGALANIAMTSSDEVRKQESLTAASETIMGMHLITPEPVGVQATRLICNLISRGDVDPQWQELGYRYRSSAPRESEQLVY